MSKVYLVGAGPGDPELLTLKGRRVLARASCVLYDHLAPEALLSFAPAEAERIYVGKKRADRAKTQDEIFAIMVDRARQGRTVVRLKGGDPFIFGRGGEEVEALAAAGIAYEVVPGVTAPLGIAAYTGVPLTHREHTSVVTFLTGHDPAIIDWSRVAGSETLVVFMGLHHAREICERLIAGGRSASTPAMAVRWGTRRDQQTIAGTLADLARRIEAAQLTPPATLIIGDVVSLHERLSWFEKLPLFGQSVVVTRARAQSAELIDLLHERGAQVLELPVIELVPLDDYSALDECIAAIERYDWIVFTSANAVEFFVARLDASSRDARAVRARVCAIGAATEAAVAALHWKVDLRPEEAVAEGVAAAFERIDMRGKRVLLPRAASARELIPEALGRMGAIVDIADAYRNIVPREAEPRAREIFAAARKPDWITFLSPSAVKNVLAVSPPGALEGVKVACIGPTTSDAARKHGLGVAVQAPEATVEALVDAICGLLA